MNIPYVFKKCGKCGEWLVASKVNFHKNKDGKYGLKSICKKCMAEYRKQWCEENKDKRKQYYEENKGKILEQRKQYYEENKDKILERNKQNYEENKDKILERNKQWCEENKDKVLEQRKQYRENNKDKRREYDKQYYEKNKDKKSEYHKQYYATPQGQIVRFNNGCRRRLREQNQGSGITKEQWLEMMKYFNFKCAYSGETLKEGTRTIDHIKPLNQGGEHEIWNIVPMYRSYNISKLDRDMFQWYKEQDFFSEERLQKIYEWQEYAFNKWHKEEKI